MALNSGLMSSNKQNWETPQQLFDELNAEFIFDLDAMADKFNHKVSQYFTEEKDSLKQDWTVFNSIFCNPPYESKIQNAVLKKAYETSLKGSTVVLLIPARTDTKRWHEYIFGKAEVRFLQGRLKFEVGGVPAKDAAPFPSAIVIYRKQEVA